MTKCLLVFSEEPSARLDYTLALCFKHVVSLSYQYTSDAKTFEDYKGPKLVYGQKNTLKAPFFIPAHGLLGEKKIKEFTPEVVHVNDNLIAFFPVSGGHISFDVFSCIFYWAARYEEYLPHQKDKQGRFEAAQSLALTHGILNEPFVHHWVQHLLQAMQQLEVSSTKPNFKFIPTVDVDTAYAYKGKGLMRTAGAMLRSALRLQFRDLSQRILTILGKKADPFDTYHHFLAVQKKYKLKTIFFFLIGDYGLNDKNLPYNSPLYRELIKYLGDYAEVALHPSFSSIKEPQNIKREADRLKAISYREINQSRQHFLVLNHPQTYHNLIKYGIEHDYTMGYASEPGFRAGLCVPYPFFDLSKNQQTELTIHPFPIMEATYKYYKQQGPEKTLDDMVELALKVKEVGGTLYSVWHNDSLSNRGDWRGWQELYPRFVERILS